MFKEYFSRLGLIAIEQTQFDLPEDYCLGKEYFCIQFFSLADRLIATEQELNQALLAQQPVVTQFIPSEIYKKLSQALLNNTSQIQTLQKIHQLFRHFSTNLLIELVDKKNSQKSK
jgi:hypothetical protein